MDWVEFVLIGTLAAGGLIGMWIGLIRASFCVIGIIAGILAVTQFRGSAESWLATYSANEGLVSLLSYVVVIVATVAITWVIARITRRLVYGLFMGWADRLGGMAVGLAVGAVLVTSIVLGMAGFSDHRSLDKGTTGKVLDYSPFGTDEINDLEAKVTGSSVASFLLSAADMIPDKARNLAPVSWLDALEDLEDRLEGIQTARR